VIAWDGTTLAADKRSTSLGLISTVTKIFRVQGGLVAFSGDYGVAMAMLNWFKNEDQRPELFPDCNKDNAKADCHTMLIDPNRDIWVFQNNPYPFRLEQSRHALGSGRDFALATMSLGFDAKRAVEVAIVHQSDCGNGVDVLKL
jgi:ATP-dependent protease HslVU (ClpYQ) peptidase subunit